MKKFLVFAGLLLLASCTEKSNETVKESNQATRENLNELAKALIEDQSWAESETLNRLKDGPVKLSEVSATPALSKATSNLHQVEIELYSNSTLDILSKKSGSSSFYIGLDPDVFHFAQEYDEEQNGLPVQEIPAFYLENGMVTETTVTLDPNNPSDKTIFFINHTSNNQPTLGKSSVTAGVYLGYRAVKLKYKSDQSAEEFEVYFSNGSNPTINYFNGTTNHIFNGRTFNDAGGASRTYPDVNNKSEYPTQDGQEIALVRVDNLTDSVRMVALEADWESGAYEMGIYNRYDQDAGTTNTLATDYYDMTDSTKKPNELSAYYVQEQGDLNDDRYEKGAIKSINLRTLNVQTNFGASYIQTVNAIGGALSHMDWTLKKLTYQ